MKTISKVVVILGLLIGSCICAMAGEVKWTLSNVLFDNGNTATGYFITDSSLNLVSFSLMVTGPDGPRDFVANLFVTSNLPTQVDFAKNPGFDPFVLLYLTSAITNAGGIISFGSGPSGNGFDCGGGPCGTLLLGGDFNPELIGTPVSEPSALLVLGSGLGIFGTMLRRKLGRA